MFALLSAALCAPLAPAPSVPHRDLYLIAGVPRTASADDISSRYSDLTMRGSPLPTDASTAFGVLTDATSRSLYDAHGSSALNRTSFSAFGPFVTFPLQFSLREFFTGAERRVCALRTVRCRCPRGGSRCARCRRSPLALEAVHATVVLPRGAPDAYRTVVRGFGDSDAVFVARAAADRVFARRGADLHAEVNVSLADALGGRIAFQGIDGEELAVPVDVSAAGRAVRLAGKGLPHYNSEKRGDLFLSLNVVFSPRARDHIE